MISSSWRPRIQDITSFMSFPGGPSVYMMRLDEIHPVVSGNKWAKLRYHIEEGSNTGKTTLLTFGGPHSNHLIATAEAARLHGLKSIGILKGAGDNSIDTPTISACIEAGMDIRYVSWSEFTYRHSFVYEGLSPGEAAITHIIPPGGADALGRKGAADIAGWIPDGVTTVCLPLGTGTTLAGLASASPQLPTIGFAATRYTHEQSVQIYGWVASPAARWLVYPDHHFKGFAKVTTELLELIKSFYTHTGIPLDIVYNAKMIYYLRRLIHRKVFRPQSKILCIHTGGLQGNPPGIFDT